MHTVIIYTGNTPSQYIVDRISKNKLSSYAHYSTDNTANLVVTSRADVIMLDVLKRVDPVQDVLLVKKIRNICGSIPIIFIVKQYEDPIYIQDLLDAGADSCIKGEFLSDEFFIRAQKLIEKKNQLLFSGIEIHMQDTSINIKKHFVSINGKEIHLTKTEYRMLIHLCMHKNILVKSNELTTCLRGNDLVQSTYLVNIHIHNLRRKLHCHTWIKTIPHRGFVAIG